MAWWMWIVLWTGLVLASAALLGWLLWRAGGGFVGVVDELGRFGEQATARWEETSAATARRIREDPTPGILVPVGQARSRYLTEREARHRKQAARRAAHRERLGSPRDLGDSRSGAQKGTNNGR